MANLDRMAKACRGGRLCPRQTALAYTGVTTEGRPYMKSQIAPMINRLSNLLLLIVLALGLPFVAYAQRPAAQAKPVVTFEEVPAKTSGITWVHNNAHSLERHLP